MRRAKRNTAKLLSAAMAVGMMAGMAVPAAVTVRAVTVIIITAAVREAVHAIILRLRITAVMLLPVTLA